MSKNTNLSFLTDYITADITNGRIGINNASPTYSFDVTGIARTSTSTYLATASGNVGIGTTSPSVNANQTSLTINGINVSRLDMQVSGTRNAGFVVASDAAYLETTAAIPLVFYTNSSERMRITSGGNVIVGSTTDVSRPFSVWGSGGIGIYSSNAYAAQLVLNFNSSTNIGYLLSDQNAFYVRTGVAKPVYVQANEANGVYLSVGATSWTANSDSRLKNIISPINNAVDKLSALNAVVYSWKSDETNKENIGLIAQDVETVLPQLIDTSQDGFLGVRYVELVPVLVKAIQELKAEIETLKNK